MKAKTIDHYFTVTKAQKVPMAFADVAALVNTKGIINPQSKGFHFKNSWIMTTTTILAVGTALFFGLNSPSTPETENNLIPITDTLTSNSQKSSPQLTAKKEIINEVGKKEITSKRQNIEKIEHQEVALFSKEAKEPKIQFAEMEIPELPEELMFYEEPNPQVAWKDSLEEANEDFTPQKSYEKTVEANPGDIFQINNSRGGITLKNWDKPFVQVEALVEMNGDEEDVRLALEDFTLNVFKTGNIITVEDNTDKYCECNCTGFSIPMKKKKRKTEEGDKYKVESVKIRYMVNLPSNISLDVKSTYGDVILNSHEGNHKIYVFKGQLFAQNLKGESDITIKYGDGNIQKVENVDFELFQSDIEVAEAGNTDLNIKYGKANFGKVENLDLASFKGDVAITESINKIDGDLKYGELELKGNVTELELTVFKARIEAQNIEKLNLDGSYTYVEAKDIKIAELEKSFQNEYKFGTVGKLEGNMQYTPLDIMLLTESLDITSFKGSLEIDEISENFKEVKLDSKYTSIDLNFNTAAKFDLDAETMYGSLDIPTTAFDTKYESQVNQTKKVKGSFNAASAKDAALVSINTFQSRVNLK